MVYYDLRFALRESADEAATLEIVREYLAALAVERMIVGFALLSYRGDAAKETGLPYLAQIRFTDDAHFSAAFAEQRRRGIHDGLHGRLMTAVREFRIEIWRTHFTSEDGAGDARLSVTRGSLRVEEADLTSLPHAETVLHLLDTYSGDPFGDGHPLSEEARRNVIAGLRQHPTTLVFLAYHESEPVGLAICFRGYSTFAARPLINISDYYVSPSSRGQGIGRLLLQAVEQKARELGCCRLTLEVQENNQRAQRVYSAAGFAQAMHHPEAGGALFFSKELV